MGAYDNPRFTGTPDYTIGFRAFEEKFQKGFQEGIERGKKLIEDDKNYIEGIEETADRMRKEGEIALANGKKTKDQIENELRSFYDEALEIDPGGKGLSGLFKVGRKKLGAMDLKQREQSFSSAVMPINTMYDKIYVEDYLIDKDEDKSDSDYALKLRLHDAVKEGRMETNFKYIKGKDGGFTSSIQIKDINGKVIEEIPSEEISRIYGNDTKAMRLAIDQDNTDINTEVEGKVEKEVANELTRLQAKGSTRASHIKGLNFLNTTIDENLGTKNIGRNEDGSYNIPVGANLERFDRLFSNHGDLDNKLQIEKLKEIVPELSNIDEKQLLAILKKPMRMGTNMIKNILEGNNFSDEQIKSIHDGQIAAKTLIYKESVKQNILNKGLLDKAYLPAPPEGGSGSGSGSDKIKLANEKAQKDVDIVAGIAGKMPNLIGETYNQGVNNIEEGVLNISSIRRSDGKGGFNIKEIVGQEFNPITKTLELKYEQESEVIEGEENGEIVRGVSAPKTGEKYKIYTLNGLEKLYSDILRDQTSTDKDIRSVYFTKNIIDALDKEFQKNQNYLNEFDNETHDKMIEKYGGIVEAGKIQYIANTPWYKAAVERYRNSQQSK